MAWEAYEVTLLNDPNSQVGKREQLSWIPINETISSYKTGLLNIPPLTFDYGLHKLVFRLEVWKWLVFTLFLHKNRLQHCIESHQLGWDLRSHSENVQGGLHLLQCDQKWPATNFNARVDCQSFPRMGTNSAVDPRTSFDWSRLSGRKSEKARWDLRCKWTSFHYQK